MGLDGVCSIRLWEVLGTSGEACWKGRRGNLFRQGLCMNGSGMMGYADEGRWPFAG